MKFQIRILGIIIEWKSKSTLARALFSLKDPNHVMGIHVSPPRVISYHPTAKDSTKIPLKGSRLGNIHSAKYERLTNVVIWHRERKASHDGIRPYHPIDPLYILHYQQHEDHCSYPRLHCYCCFSLLAFANEDVYCKWWFLSKEFDTYIVFQRRSRI